MRFSAVSLVAGIPILYLAILGRAVMGKRKHSKAAVRGDTLTHAPERRRSLGNMKAIAIFMLTLACALESTGSLSPNLLRIRIRYDEKEGEQLIINGRHVSRQRLNELAERLVALNADQHVWVIVDRNVPSSIFLFVTSMLSEKGFRHIRVLPPGGRDDGISPGRVAFVIEYHIEIEECVDAVTSD